MGTLFLTASDVSSVLGFREAIEAVRGAFADKETGMAVMPPKSYVIIEEHSGDFRTMPAYLRKTGATGVKIVNVHPENRSHGLPTVMATIVLLDPKTGYPIAVMDGTFITNIRTGAAGALAAEYLARRDSKIVGVVGTGVQARFQLLALSEVLDVERVKACGRDEDSCRRYASEMRERTGVEVETFKRVEDAVRGCDIVVTTTPSRSPLVMNEWIDCGTHINAIGADAPGKQELDPAILRRSKLVVDDREQAVHSGEINVPLSRGEITIGHIYAELGEIVCGKKKGRTSDEEITVFDSTGLAVQDIATAELVYREARRRGLGREMDLMEL